MKARKVKHLDPQGPLADNLERIVRVRLRELTSFMPRAADPREVDALHDMRIAAKRLRYILEVSEGLFGPYASRAGKRAKELQDLLGEIHDCDVTIPRISLIERKAKREDLEAVVAGGPMTLPPNNAAYQGLAAMITERGAHRALLFKQFEELWLDLEREGFAARLRFAITERSSSHDVNGSAGGQSYAP
jgi:CHAD domain-containing protein